MSQSLDTKQTSPPTSLHFFSTTVAARLGKTKHACNHDYEKLRPRPFLRTTCAKTIFDIKKLLLPNVQEPQVSTTNNQANKNAQDWFPKWVPKWIPKRGPKTGTKIGTELGACLLFLINKTQNWPPKRGPKMNPKTVPKTGPKSSPQERM